MLSNLNKEVAQTVSTATRFPTAIARIVADYAVPRPLINCEPLARFELKCHCPPRLIAVDQDNQRLYYVCVPASQDFLPGLLGGVRVRELNYFNLSDGRSGSVPIDDDVDCFCIGPSGQIITSIGSFVCVRNKDGQVLRSGNLGHPGDSLRYLACR